MGTNKVCCLLFLLFVKNLLEYSDDFSRSVAKASFWYLDTGTTAVDAQNVCFAARRALTSNRKQVNVKIPLNRYSLFEELEGRILPPMQLNFEIDLNPDVELLFGSVDTTRVTIDRFYLWVPKILPKDSLAIKYVSDFQKPSRWKYLKEKHFVSEVTRNAVDYRIDSSIINDRHVFVLSTQLSMALFFKETPGKMDAVNPVADDDDANQEKMRDLIFSCANLGLKARYAFTKNRNTMDMMDPIHSDIFFQDRLILNGVNLRLKLNRAKYSFCLVSPGPGAAFKVAITEAILYVHKVKMASSVTLGHAAALKETTAK